MTKDHRHFHLFPLLPPELQDHIWHLAVRPLPGTNHVHTFYLADHYVHKPTVSQKYQAEFLHFNAGRHGWTLGVPRRRNRSAYRLDSGLWRACRQSRRALMNYFGSNKYWAPELDGFQPSPSAEIDVRDENTAANAHTGVYIDTNGEKQYVTIRPKTDLVHILDPVGHYWFHQYAGDYVSLFDAPGRGWGAGQRAPGFVGRNVAVDFEPDWAEKIPGDVADMLDVLYTDAVRTVWFVDYRLKRRQDKQDGSGAGSAASGSSRNNSAGEGMVFYGSGYKLTEVKKEQLGLWELEPGSKTAFDCFDRFERDTNGRLEVDDPDRLGVLAVESV